MRVRKRIDSRIKIGKTWAKDVAAQDRPKKNNKKNNDLGEE
jgi:hypothetical protein